MVELSFMFQISSSHCLCMRRNAVSSPGLSLVRTVQGIHSTIYEEYYQAVQYFHGLGSSLRHWCPPFPAPESAINRWEREQQTTPSNSNPDRYISITGVCMSDSFLLLGLVARLLLNVGIVVIIDITILKRSPCSCAQLLYLGYYCAILVVLDQTMPDHIRPDLG